MGGRFDNSLGSGKPITVTASLENVGSPAVLTLYSDFDESTASYVEGSSTNGAVPVRATRAQIESAVRRGGVAALQALRVAPGEATAIVGTSPDTLSTGEVYSFTYALQQKQGPFPYVSVVNRAFGVSVATTGEEESVLTVGSRLFAPIIGR